MGSNVSDEVFQSGPWVGFYNYGAGQPRHRMDLHLTFASGVMSGEGNDDVGRFLVRGKYDAPSRECFWTKTYLGSHDVFYRGFREGKGIWGTWEIGVLNHGGFHIWPKAAGEGDQEHEAFEESQPADAIGIMTPPGPLAQRAEMRAVSWSGSCGSMSFWSGSTCCRPFRWAGGGSCADYSPPR